MIIFRAFIAGGMLLGGLYVLWEAIPTWAESGFPLSDYPSEKGKSAASALLFGLIFVAYGLMEIYNLLFRHRQTK